MALGRSIPIFVFGGFSIKGKEAFSKGTVLVKNMDGTFSWLDVNEMEWESPWRLRMALGDLVVSEREADCFRLAAKFNDISRKHQGVTFLLKSEVIKFFRSNLGAEVLRALMDGEETCDAWKNIDEFYVEMLSNPNSFKGLEDFAH